MQFSGLGSTAIRWAAASILGAGISFALPAHADETPVSGGDLVMVRATPIQSLMPTLVSDNASIWALEEIFDPLLLPTVDGKGVKPNLATTWTQSADGLEWTFKLRDDVKFSDGTPMTSKDVKFSLEKASDPDTPFGFINEAIDTITTPDDYTVVIKTKRPFAPLPSVIAIFSNSVVPFDYGGKSAEDFAAHPIGTGPFKLDSLTVGVGAKLSRNPLYWQKGKPYLDTVTFSEVADDNTRANQLVGGQAQINEFPPYSSIKSLQQSSEVKVGIFDSSRVDFLTFNTTRAPFDDVHVRRAIAYAIDKKALVKVVLFGNGAPATAYMPPSSWSHNADVTGRPFDLKAAKAELAQSSKPNGFEATIMVKSGDADASAKAQIIQATLAQIGIKITIQVLDPSAQIAARNAKNFDMTFTYNTTDIVDPDEIIRFAGVYDGGSHTLWSYYDNKEMADLAAKAATLEKQDDRKALYDQMQAKWEEDQPLVALYYSPEVYSYTTKVQGFHPFVTGNYGLVDVWLSK